MRWLGWILVVLLAVSWGMAELPPLLASKPPADRQLWRRTRSGWERADWLLPQPAPPPLWAHPGLFAALQVTASVGGLCCASGQNRTSQSPRRGSKNSQAIQSL